MIKKAIPSVITSMGLLAGSISIVYTSVGDLYLAGIFILAAAVFDFLDGMVARMCDSISEFGKQLDSLADVVSFGVAPAMIVRQFVQFALVASDPEASFDIQSPGFFAMVIMHAAFLIAVFSALRLAKFNIDKEQVSEFRGLPTPANALLIAGMGFAMERSQELVFVDLIFNRWFLLIFIILSCYLLVSRIRMFSLKFKTFSIKQNSLRYFFLGASLVLLVVFKLPALSPIIVLYILLSLLSNAVCKSS